MRLRDDQLPDEISKRSWFKPTTLNATDTKILARKLALLEAVEGPRVGDFVVFESHPRRPRRVSEFWFGGAQTSDGGSFHLGEGSLSFSGGLAPAVPLESLTLTEHTRTGSCWFFHHDSPGAGRGITVYVPFRVYYCPLDMPF